MSDAFDILEEYAEENGWDTESMLVIICEYVDNQFDQPTFEDFVIEKVEIEKKI